MESSKENSPTHALGGGSNLLTWQWESSPFAFETTKSFGSFFIHFFQDGVLTKAIRHVKPRMKCNESELKSEIYVCIYGCDLFQITSQTSEKYYHYRKIKIKIMGCLYSNWIPTFLRGGGGGEGGHFHSIVK